jgi:peptidoglycan/LPS O-acetylase OafA/YrhL
LTYRSDIDGLRALAVAAVVFYHFGLGFPGGYVGVDVFFVLSGYLISRQILKDSADGRFTMVGFWERRIRRIFPAMAFMLLGVAVAAWIILYPADYRSFARSLIAQNALVANFYFLKSVGYFSANNELPLLHTWSLAVEEQFYLFCPLLLICLVRRCRPPAQLAALATIALASFFVSAATIRSHPSWTFYMLPSRGWELLLGAILNLVPYKVGFRSGAEFGSLLGLGAILAACFGYSDSTPFPGPAALLPCLGTTLVIWANSAQSTFTRSALSFPPLVFVGLISYSLYLWHWPILVFAKYLSDAELSLPARLTLVLGSVALATLSWKWVESPVRRREVIRTRPGIFLLYFAFTVAFIAEGFTIAAMQGMPSRFPLRTLNYLAAQDDYALRETVSLNSALKGDLVVIGQRGAPLQLLVWGDSHAMAILPVLDALCRDFHVEGRAATHGATSPLLDLAADNSYALSPRDTLAYNRAILEFVRRNHVKNVLLAARWELYGLGDSPPERLKKIRRNLSETLVALHNAGARTFIFKTVPSPGFDVPRFLARTSSEEEARSFRLPPRTQSERINFEHVLFDQYQSADLAILDPNPFFLDPDGWFAIERKGWSLYSDDNHLSIHGTAVLRDLFLPIFQR